LVLLTIIPILGCLWIFGRLGRRFGGSGLRAPVYDAGP
jgi:hypothetical protein